MGQLEAKGACLQRHHTTHPFRAGLRRESILQGWVRESHKKGKKTPAGKVEEAPRQKGEGDPVDGEKNHSHKHKPLGQTLGNCERWSESFLMLFSKALVSNLWHSLGTGLGTAKRSQLNGQPTIDVFPETSHSPCGGRRGPGEWCKIHSAHVAL